MAQQYQLNVNIVLVSETRLRRRRFASQKYKSEVCVRCAVWGHLYTIARTRCTVLEKLVFGYLFQILYGNEMLTRQMSINRNKILRNYKIPSTGYSGIILKFD